MGIIKKAMNIFKGKANAVLDGMENPMEQYDNLIREHEEAYKTATRESSGFTGELMQLKQDRQKKQDEYDKTYSAAKKAKHEDQNEELAKKFLAKTNEIKNELNTLDSTIASLQGAVDKNKARLKELKDKIDGFKKEKVSLNAEYNTSKALGKVNEIMAGVSPDCNESIDSIRDKVRKQTNYANGLDELTKTEDELNADEYLATPSATAVDEEFNKL